jgi:hypothetical protein
MTREDERIFGLVVDPLHRSDGRRDLAAHAATIRQAVRSALRTVAVLEYASAKAQRRP